MLALFIVGSQSPLANIINYYNPVKISLLHIDSAYALGCADATPGGQAVCEAAGGGWLCMRTGDACTEISWGGGGWTGADRATIYTSIWNTLSGWGIANNLNTVTSGNVTSFSGLYFAKMTGSDEMWRITFYTGLDLTDTGTQNFLQYDLSTSITMDQGHVSFNPGTGFIGKAAQLVMNFSITYSGEFLGMDNNDFVVRDESGNIISNDIISNVVWSTCAPSWQRACPLTFDVGHFTQFDLKTFLTAVHISSDNWTGAGSGNTIYLAFTGNAALASVTATIWGHTATVTGGGNFWSAQYTLTGNGTSGQTIPFTIDFTDFWWFSGNQITWTTDGSYVQYSSWGDWGWSWFSRENIYGNIGSQLVSYWILNNFNQVTNDNVNYFTGLYFAKNSGSNELGRITFYTWLDLTDTGTQNFLSGELPNSIWMQQGQIRFNPGSWFEGKNATLTINLPNSREWFLSSISVNDFYVREGSGGAITGNDVITNVYSGGACTGGDFGCSIYLDVAHFTSFEIARIKNITQMKGYNDIQLAINEANTGDTLLSTFRSWWDATINKSLNFTGNIVLDSVTLDAPSIFGLSANTVRVTSQGKIANGALIVNNAGNLYLSWENNPTFYESGIIINKNNITISVTGAPIIDCGGAGTAITINSLDVWIRHIAFQNCTKDVVLSDSANWSSTIQDSSIGSMIENLSLTTWSATSNRWWSGAEPIAGINYSGLVNYTPRCADSWCTTLTSGYVIESRVRNITQDIWYNTIGEAMADPNITSSDIITVASGLYEEDFSINQMITLSWLDNPIISWTVNFGINNIVIQWVDVKNISVSNPNYNDIISSAINAISPFGTVTIDYNVQQYQEMSGPININKPLNIVWAGGFPSINGVSFLINTWPVNIDNISFISALGVVVENTNGSIVTATGNYRWTDYADPLANGNISGDVVYAPRCNDQYCNSLTETTYADSKVKNTTLLRWYSTISDAFMDPSLNDGDIITVASGVYDEWIDINKLVTLSGLDNPIISGQVQFSKAGIMQWFTVMDIKINNANENNLLSAVIDAISPYGTISIGYDAQSYFNDTPTIGIDKPLTIIWVDGRPSIQNADFSITAWPVTIKNLKVDAVSFVVNTTGIVLINDNIFTNMTNPNFENQNSGYIYATGNYRWANFKDPLANGNISGNVFYLPFCNDQFCNTLIYTSYADSRVKNVTKSIGTDTINAAIMWFDTYMGAENGDVIVVESGVYDEGGDISISRSITLSWRNNPTISWGRLYLNTNNILIQGFDLPVMYLGVGASVADAVNMVNSGGTVMVDGCGGSCANEETEIIINKPMSIIGNSVRSTWFDRPDVVFTSGGLVVNSPNVTISYMSFSRNGGKVVQTNYTNGVNFNNCIFSWGVLENTYAGWLSATGNYRWSAAEPAAWVDYSWQVKYSPRCTNSECTGFDTLMPVWTIQYSITWLTNQNVTATISFNRSWITVTNNSWTAYIFTGNGSFTFEFENIFGDTGSTTATVNNIDKTAVTWTIAYSPATLTSGTVIASITFNKTGVTVINNSWLTWYIFNTTGWFTFTFQDAAGNTWSTTATVDWIDTTTPTATISYSTTGLTNQDVIATLTGYSENITGTMTYTFTGNGTYVFNFTDLAGNPGIATGTVNTIDKTAPTATISYSPASLTSGNVVAILTWYSKSLTGLNATWHTFTGNGSFTFTFSDLAGNTWSTTATVDWIDTTTPTATISYSTTGLTNQDIIATLSWSEAITGTTTYTFTGNGTYVFNFTDLVGNPGIATGTVTWIDKTPVTGSVSYSPATFTNGNVVASISFNKTWVTVINNSGLTWYTFTTTGAFTFTFQDAAGNTGATTATVTWIDNTAPTASVTYTNTWANILATLTGYSETLTWINATSKLFTGNGSFTFTFSDLAGNTWNVLASAIITILGTTNSTGTTNIWWATTTGITFTSTGTLNIVSTGSISNQLQLNVSWLIIQTSWGTWDGVLNPPTNLDTGDSNNATTTKIWLTDTSTTTHTVLLTIQAWATTDSLVASGGYFNVSFVVSAGTNGDILHLYRSENGTTWVANTPDATCTLDSSLVCNFRTDHLSYFAPVKVTTSGGGWGWGGGGSAGGSNVTKDYCPNGDISPSFYDNICTAITGAVGANVQTLGTIIWSEYSTEFNNAYLYAYNIGITTIKTIQQADMWGSLFRAPMAKMMVNYAIKVLDKTPDTWAVCEFNDIANQSTEMKTYIKLACQLGLMWVGMINFEPNTGVTRAQFGTVLSRALYGKTYDGVTPYYIGHLSALKAADIISNTNPDLKEVRGYVMLMLMRAKK